MEVTLDFHLTHHQVLLNGEGFSSRIVRFVAKEEKGDRVTHSNANQFPFHFPVSPFQCIHPPSSRFTTEPPKQAATEPPTPIHSSADVEGRNHHRVLLLAEPASSLPSPNVPELAEPASSFAVAERRRARQLVGASPTPRPHSPPRVLRLPSSSSKMWAIRCLPLRNRVLRPYCSKATWVVEDDSGTSKRPWPSWKKIPDATRKSWWEKFKSQHQFFPPDLYWARKNFERRGVALLKSLLGKARKSRVKPQWIEDDVWDSLCTYWNADTGFLKKSAQGKSNRASDCGGFGASLHTAGPISISQHKTNMKKSLKRTPTLLELFAKTHKHKDETWVDKKSKYVEGEFKNAMEQVIQKTSEEGSNAPDETDVWQEIAGSKKGKIYGLGLESTVVDKRLSFHGSNSQASEWLRVTEHKEIMRKMQEENAYLKARLDKKERRLKLAEHLLRQMIKKKGFNISLKFVYLAIGIGVAAFLQVVCWMVTGERQAARIRGLYLKTILRQDIAFFDKETNTGEVIGRMSGDTVLIQDAMGEKVASFTGEKQAVSSYEKRLEDAYKSGVSEGIAAGMGFGVVTCVIFCGYALAVWYGSKMIMEKGYNGGMVVNVMVAALSASMSLGEASPCLSAFASGKAAAYKMFQTIERKPEIDAYDPTGKTLEDIHGDIELRDVYFSYPARPEELIFNGFSLHIPSGTTAALVGQSGSGKSTVISLMERFYDPQAGEVLIDGINIREFQVRWIRGKVGLVSQEPVLFASSIKDNIAYGKEGATIEEIKVATELANAANFIDKLPKGLETMVGEHGTQLSGGQKQRIAIARAILKDPRILLLDEATSALDAESERIVQEALDRIMINRTTVIVAHRLSTVKNADMIAVIHRGKMRMYEEASQVANDAVGSIRTVASFCAEEKVMEFYKKKCEGPRKTGIRQGLISGIGFGVSFFLLYCVYATCFYAGARFVKDGKASFSDVLRVFFALTMAANAISQSSSLAPDSSKAKSAAASIFGLLDMKSKIDPSDESGTTLDNVNGEIKFRHVGFKYPSRPDIQIFRDLSLTIHSGKTVALVGESGSGKSTVIALLQRFFDPDFGQITLDGIEIQKLQLKWLRQQIGLVGQEPVLFNDTIRANIAYGKGGNATEAEIIQVAELANAHGFISALQQGGIPEKKLQL
ncbi:hypothetical protein Ahy_B06g080584 isoform E [Arachis hypogaea]|uniref:ABC transporter B family member n=1 Tax=Arachis hypogaea TaxID=3818 RepID=A0A444YID3_ARAHY|nr:hypothetical protein Ahy_B06g080584 isoform E [Arachis hypogaea]